MGRKEEGELKSLFLWAAFFALVAFASGAMAIRKPGPEPAPEAAGSTAPGKPVLEKVERFSGVIEKVDGKEKIIVVKGKMMNGGKILTFVIANKTKITKGNTMMTPSDLKKDMQVSVEYKKGKDKMIAVAIEVSIL